VKGGVANMEPPALEFRQVGMSFGDKEVLSGVSFEVRRNQMMIVTGLSNSGKSVLLHLAMGLVKPCGGQILIEGIELGTLSESELLALRSSAMGIAFQENALFTGLSVFDNTAYRLVEHNWPESKIETAVREILRFVGLEQDAEKFPEELSIGMRHRLEMARALIGWPRIMLLDEPVSGLDPVNARQILDLVIRARDLHGISVLYVTKETHEIHYLANHFAAEESGAVEIRKGSRPGAPEIKILLLESGKVAFLGDPPAFEASTLLSVRRFVGDGYIAAF